MAPVGGAEDIDLRPILKSIVGLTALAALFAANAAPAQETIATAVHDPILVSPNAAPEDTLRLDGYGRGPDVLGPRGPCGGPAKTADGRNDRTPHGEVWAAAGTHGYREAGGAVCLPLSDRSAVSIAIDAGQMNGWGRRH